jgi:hypothetical protein
MVEYLDSQVRKMYELIDENPDDLNERIVGVYNELQDYRKKQITDRESEVLASKRGKEIISWFRKED